MEFLIRVNGVPPWDGEYPLDITFKNRELHQIKTLTGLRPAEFQDAIEQRDADIVVAMALIAMRRAGKGVTADELWDAEAGSLVLDATEDDEAESVPPVEAPPTDEPSSGAHDVSGPASNGTLESPEQTLSAIGIQG